MEKIYKALYDKAAEKNIFKTHKSVYLQFSILLKAHGFKPVGYKKFCEMFPDEFVKKTPRPDYL